VLVYKILCACCYVQDLNKNSSFNTFAVIQAGMIGSFFLGTALLIIVSFISYRHCIILYPITVMTLSHTILQVYYGITLWYIRKVYAFQGESSLLIHTRTQRILAFLNTYFHFSPVYLSDTLLLQLQQTSKETSTSLPSYGGSSEQS
jgi:hypothetical protein